MMREAYVKIMLRNTCTLETNSWKLT